LLGGPRKFFHRGLKPFSAALSGRGYMFFFSGGRRLLINMGIILKNTRTFSSVVIIFCKMFARPIVNSKKGIIGGIKF
jgi:hypothetical protein